MVLSDVGLAQEVRATGDQKGGVGPQMQLAFFVEIDFETEFVEAVKDDDKRALLQVCDFLDTKRVQKIDG